MLTCVCMRRSGPVLQEAKEAEIIHNYRMKRGLMDASEFLKDGKVDVEEMEKIKKINYVSGKWRTSACRVAVAHICVPCRSLVLACVCALCPWWRAYVCRAYLACVCVSCACGVRMRAVPP